MYKLSENSVRVIALEHEFFYLLNVCAGRRLLENIIVNCL